MCFLCYWNLQFLNNVIIIKTNVLLPRHGWLLAFLFKRRCCGRDHMVVEFTTTYLISAYNH
jgi:hypothetical protein